jgi:hypothetical protein
VTAPQTLRLRPRQWIRLPGTAVEVLIHGRARMIGGQGYWVPVSRTGNPGGRLGGWDLSPVHGHAFIRRTGR